MRFAHLSDCHLGSWRKPELRKLNLKAFQKAIEQSINERVDFVLITGDLFDSAYPSVEILEEAFYQLRKLKEKEIECYYIAGSHDYSASGKTFLTVLEKAGFCKNMFKPDEDYMERIKNNGSDDKNNKDILLTPIHHGNVALYGYPGKKSGMEVDELKRVKLQGSPGLFRIFALHTTVTKAGKKLPIETVDEEKLPEAEYYALGHLHINYENGRYVYAGPTFPNNFKELEELKNGKFYIIETDPFKIDKKELKMKEVEILNMEISNALNAKERIISELNKRDIEDKIVLIRLHGNLKQGKISSINFSEIEKFVESRNAFTLLKSTSKLEAEEPEFDVEVENMEKLEKEIVEKYKKDNPSQFNKLIDSLVDSLVTDKREDETNDDFEERIANNTNKIFNIEDEN